MKNKLSTTKQTYYLLIGTILLSEFSAIGQAISTFDDLPLRPETYYDGSDKVGGFKSGDSYFYTNYNTEYAFWSGFIYSNTSDIKTESYKNGSSAITGTGYNGSSTYAIGNGSPKMKLLAPLGGAIIKGFLVTNTTYAYLSMKTGDSYAKTFGGATGNDPDWFKLSITGYLQNALKKDTVHFYLADFRNNDNTKDYLLDTWKWVDLTGLGLIDSLAFSLSSSDNTGGFMNTPAYFAMDNFNDPLFAPAAGLPGTNAMHADSSAFVAWATAAAVVRGPQDISAPSEGLATTGLPINATGKGGNASGLLSLGDGGSATMTFSSPIVNGTGPDFAVFENGFSTNGLHYLELAFVEVSSDGINFFRFPATSHTETTRQTGGFEGSDAQKIDNLAGKFAANYGTPFDLEILKNTTGLDVNNITHVKVVDVVGSIDVQYATKDVHGNIVNDPWPTKGGSSGFDLDAVGVIHTQTPTAVNQIFMGDNLNIYPNPSQNSAVVFIRSSFIAGSVVQSELYNNAGHLVNSQYGNAENLSVSLIGMQPGIYFIKVEQGGVVFTKKLIVN